MSKKSCPIIIVDTIYDNGQDFLNIQCVWYIYKNINKKISKIFPLFELFKAFEMQITKYLLCYLYQHLRNHIYVYIFRMSENRSTPLPLPSSHSNLRYLKLQLWKIFIPTPIQSGFCCCHCWVHILKFNQYVYSNTWWSSRKRTSFQILRHFKKLSLKI